MKGRTQTNNRRVPACRRAMVLVIVLVAISLLSLAGYTFAEMMFAEHEAVHIHGRGIQTRALVDSGVELVKLYLEQTPDVLQEIGGLYDNPALFQGVPVIDHTSARRRGRFSVVSSGLDESGYAAVRYGLADESARLNINAIIQMEDANAGDGRQLLMALPGMTEELADAILDFLDADDTIRELGAEINEYSGMVPAYGPKNGPLESLEELLLVRGMAPSLLFGADMNRNGMIDEHEQAGTNIEGVDNSDGSMDRGWSAYLTIYSQEALVDPDGQQRIDLNGDDLETLHDDLAAILDNEKAAFIVAYRQFGPAETDAPGVSADSVALDFEQEGGTRIESVLDLVGVKVELPAEEGQEPIVLESPFSDRPSDMDGYLPELLDYVTVDAEPLVAGRININQAPRVVLLAIPGMDEQTADRIISRRYPEVTAENPAHRHPTWLLSEEIVTLERMKQWLPILTSAGGVYRAQVVGYFDEGGPASRAEVVVDTTGGSARVLSLKNMSHLGRGYTLETLGVQ